MDEDGFRQFLSQPFSCFTLWFYAFRNFLPFLFNLLSWHCCRMKTEHCGNLEPCHLVWSRSIPQPSHLTSHGMFWDSVIIQALAGMRSAMLQWSTSMEIWSHGSILPWANLNHYGQSMLTLRTSMSKPAISVSRLACPVREFTEKLFCN